MSNTQIIWQDPPEKGKSAGRPHKKAPFVAALRETPGRWALYPSPQKSAGAANDLKLRGCETALRRRDDGAFDVYARWPVAS